MIEQISILIENRQGTLAEVTKALAGAGVSLKAFSINDTSDFGILRIIVDDVDKAGQALGKEGFGYTISEVVAIELEDKAGALNSLLEALKDTYNVNYIYSMVLRTEGLPLLIISIDPKEGVEDFLRGKGFKVYDME